MLIVDNDGCNRDGPCVAVCPVTIIEMNSSESYPSWIEGAKDLCLNCGHCVAVCPNGALTVNDMTPEKCGEIRDSLMPSAAHVDHFLRRRRSIRNFRNQAVDRKILNELITIASYAPSGHNTQPVRWLVIENKEDVNRLAGVVIEWLRECIENQPEIAQPLHMDRIVAAWENGIDRVLRSAPHVVVAYADPASIAAPSACIIALTYLELAAWAMGLGACWAGYLNRAANSFAPMMKALDLPPGHQVFGAMMIGYAKYTFQRIPVRNAPKILWK